MDGTDETHGACALTVIVVDDRPLMATWFDLLRFPRSHFHLLRELERVPDVLEQVAVDVVVVAVERDVSTVVPAVELLRDRNPDLTFVLVAPALDAPVRVGFDAMLLGEGRFAAMLDLLQWFSHVRR